MLKDKGLFLKAETQTALWLPWDTVGQLIGDKMEKLLQMTAMRTTGIASLG